jgi:hypothetical protein
MAKECFFVAYDGHWETLKKSEKWTYTEKKFSKFLDAFDFFQTAPFPKYIGHISENGFKSEVSELGIEKLMNEEAKQIIKDLLDTQYQLDPYLDVFKDRIKRAEDFLERIK